MSNVRRSRKTPTMRGQSVAWRSGLSVPWQSGLSAPGDAQSSDDDMSDPTGDGDFVPRRRMTSRNEMVTSTSEPDIPPPPYTEYENPPKIAAETAQAYAARGGLNSIVARYVQPFNAGLDASAATSRICAKLNLRSNRSLQIPVGTTSMAIVLYTRRVGRSNVIVFYWFRDFGYIPALSMAPDVPPAEIAETGDVLASAISVGSTSVVKDLAQPVQLIGIKRMYLPDMQMMSFETCTAGATHSSEQTPADKFIYVLPEFSEPNVDQQVGTVDIPQHPHPTISASSCYHGDSIFHNDVGWNKGGSYTVGTDYSIIFDTLATNFIPPNCFGRWSLDFSLSQVEGPTQVPSLLIVLFEFFVNCVNTDENGHVTPAKKVFYQAVNIEAGASGSLSFDSSGFNEAAVRLWSRGTLTQIRVKALCPQGIYTFRCNANVKLTTYDTVSGPAVSDISAVFASFPGDTATDPMTLAVSMQQQLVYTPTPQLARTTTTELQSPGHPVDSDFAAMVVNNDALLGFNKVMSKEEYALTGQNLQSLASRKAHYAGTASFWSALASTGKKVAATLLPGLAELGVRALRN